MPVPSALVESYLRRIGYRGPTQPTLPVLQAIAAHHVETIPFENLDVLLGRPIGLTVEAIAAKLVDEGRGGYCFEQNGLLLDVLRTLGFAVRPLSARVRFQQPPDVVTPRTHLFLRVDLEGEGWLVDVGFGGFSLATAIRLGTEEPQETPHEPRRIVSRDGRFFHQVRLADTWHDLSEFTGEDMPLVDRELGSWFTSTHPTSSFRHRLVAARALPAGERFTLQNRELSHRRPGGVVDVAVIETPEALLGVLAGSFGLHFPPGTTFPCSGLDWPDS